MRAVSGRSSSSAPARWAARCSIAGWRAASTRPGRRSSIHSSTSERAAALAGQGVAIASRRRRRRRTFDVMVLAVKPQIDGRHAGARSRRSRRRDALVISIAAGVRLATLERGFRARAADRPRHAEHAGADRQGHDGRGRQRSAANRSSEARSRRSSTRSGEVGLGRRRGADRRGDGGLRVRARPMCSCSPNAWRRPATEAGLPPNSPLSSRGRPSPAPARFSTTSPLPPRSSAQNVTSPNGTTAAALAVLMAPDGLGPLLTKAVEAARKRSVELG